MISKFFARSFAIGGVAAATLVPMDAAACGGFFCSSPTQPVNQAAERIIFAQNDDQTVTAVIQILYQGSAPKFSWLLPIASVPLPAQVKVASNLAFQRLQAATNPQYNLTTRVEGTCLVDPRSGGGVLGAGGSTAGGPTTGPGGGGVTVNASGTVGPFNWEVISVAASLADPADAALSWLTDNGYSVSPGAAGLIRPYLEQGLHLLAVRLIPGADSGSIRPLSITYDSAQPMIPIKLTAVAANDDMGVMTWLLSSARAVPQNYLSLELNQARINWFNANANYNDVVTAAANDASGQGFVTEFAGPSTALGNVVWSDANEAQWQFFASSVYTSFQQIFDASYNQWGNFDGFWDAVRETVTLPTGVTFEDFKLCPSCYSSQIAFMPAAFVQSLQTNVIQPMKDVQALLDGHAYATRLYTTMSAAEMTVDPLFTFNPSLADVSNIHSAVRVIECNPNVSQFDAPWRIELPEGVVRGTGAQVGTWPAAFTTQPANTRILQLSSSGAGHVVEDNSQTIHAALAAYDPAQTGSAGSAGSGANSATGTSKGSWGCSATRGGAPAGGSVLAAFAALAWLVRRRSQRGSTST